MTKKRADSSHVMTKTFSDAAKLPDIPEHISLREDALPFFYNIYKARHEWNDSDLAMACNLARCDADIELYQKQLDEEGAVIKNDRGTPIMNPLHTVVESLTRRAVALRRALQVHAQATQGESKLQRGKNQAKKKASEILQNMTDDDLIARPH